MKTIGVFISMLLKIYDAVNSFVQMVVSCCEVLSSGGIVSWLIACFFILYRYSPLFDIWCQDPRYIAFIASLSSGSDFQVLVIFNVVADIGHSTRLAGG